MDHALAARRLHRAQRRRGLSAVTALAAQDRPLPDQESFTREVRARLRTDSSLQSGYIYTETRREQKLDGSGKVKEESVKVYESYPGLPGEGERWERLLSENGRPRPASELEKELRDRQKKAEALAREATEQPAKLQAQQQREAAEQRRESTRCSTISSRLQHPDGAARGDQRTRHDRLLATPRPNAKPRTREGSQMRKVIVRAWISESEKELVRVDADVIDTLSVGLGLLARVHKGSKFSFLRTKVNNEVWLPSRFTVSFSARLGLVAVLRRSGGSEFSGYLKFSVDTSTTIEAPTP